MTDDSSAAVELQGVRKSFGIGSGQRVRAADDVSLTVGAGAFVALTGASGSGKSTVLHLIGAIERPDAGRIIAAGADVTALRGDALASYRRTVGLVFQRYNLLPALTALDNIPGTGLPHGAAPSASGNQRTASAGATEAAT